MLDVAVTSTIRENPEGDGYLGYDKNGITIAAIDLADKNGKYKITWIDGPQHGITSVAHDWQDVNERVNYIAKLFFNKD